MRFAARLLAPIACAAALAVVPATPAHAGCTEDLIAALSPGPFGIIIDPDRYVEVSGIDITIHTGAVVGDALSITFFAYGRVLTLVFATPGAMLAFLNCVVL